MGDSGRHVTESSEIRASGHLTLNARGREPFQADGTRTCPSETFAPGAGPLNHPQEATPLPNRHASPNRLETCRYQAHTGSTLCSYPFLCPARESGTTSRTPGREPPAIPPQGHEIHIQVLALVLPFQDISAWDEQAGTNSSFHERSN